MSYKLVRWENETVTPKHDSMQWDDGRIGILNGCEITSLGANKLRIASGYMVVLGRLIEFSQTDINCEVSSSGTLNGQMILRLDLDASNPVEIVTEASASLTPLTQNEDFNYENGIYEVQLATYNINETTISNLVVKVDKPTGLKEVTENLTTSDGTNEIPFRYAYQDGKDGRILKVNGADTFFPFLSGLDNLSVEEVTVVKTSSSSFYINDEENNEMYLYVAYNNAGEQYVKPLNIQNGEMIFWGYYLYEKGFGVAFIKRTNDGNISFSTNSNPGVKAYAIKCN